MAGDADARFDFERLDVFRVALEVVAILDDVAEELPDGRGYIRDQLRRAANSIPLNIAEGAGEFLPAERRRGSTASRSGRRPSARARSSCAGVSESPTPRAWRWR